MSPRPSGTPGVRSRARLHLRRPRGQAAGPRLPQGARGGKRRCFRTVRAKPLLHLVPEEKGKDGSRPGGGGGKRSPIPSSPPSSASGRGGAEVKRAGGRAPRRLPQADEEGGSGGFLPGVVVVGGGDGSGPGAAGRGGAAAITCRVATREHPPGQATARPARAEVTREGGRTDGRTAAPPQPAGRGLAGIRGGG